MTVTYNEISYECTYAYKRTNSVHLVDANSNIVAAFEGISDFSGFSFSSGGSFTTPTDADHSYLTALGVDGTVLKTTKRCCDITPVVSSTTDLTAGSSTLATGTLYLVYE